MIARSVLLRLGGVLVMLALVSGCSSGGEQRAHGPALRLFSPNGEPLSGGVLGQPSCETAQGSWFDRTDADHDGTVNRAEFLADASAQFQRMDIDRNGYLLTEELERYRLPYRQETAADGHHPLPSDLTDPVMAADRNNDFKVTPEEFLAQADRTFTDLDADHNGRIDRDGMLRTCKLKPGQR